jgi:hypothetical protein
VVLPVAILGEHGYRMLAADRSRCGSEVLGLEDVARGVISGGGETHAQVAVWAHGQAQARPPIAASPRLRRTAGTRCVPPPLD